MNWTALAKVISEKGWLGFGLLALVLIAMGATESVPWLGPVKTPSQYLLMLFSALAFVVAAVGYWNEQQQRAAGAAAEAGRSDVHAEVKKLGFTVDSPKPDSTIKVPAKYKGTAKRKPPKGYEVWLVDEGSIKGIDQFWPQKRVLIPSNRKWTLEYHPPDAKPMVKAHRFYLVGPDAQKLFDLYYKINQPLVAFRGEWEGISATGMTSDIAPVTDPIRVTVVD